MDPLITQALRAGRAPVARRTAGARMLVAGGAGALGAAVLEHLLAHPGFVEISVLVTQPLGAGLMGLNPVTWVDGNAPFACGATSAVIVFDRERHANGREQAFWRPDPATLPALAGRLRASGVRHLTIVQPHVSAGLPRALRLGLANLDEQGIAGLGFEHLVLMRPAQAPVLEGDGHPGHRLARWMLSQLQLMVPPQDKPVRAAKVARFAVQIAARLPQATPGTRVVPADLVWEAAQRNDLAALAADWLAGRSVAPSAAPVPRL